MKINKIPNQAIKGALTPLNLKNVTGLALHHMAHGTADIKTVEGWHINQGYSAIGYNFWVGDDGTVYEGRGFNLGAHTLGFNATVIGIGFQGDYHSKACEMPTEQFNSGIDIIEYVLGAVPSISKMGGHKDFMATACPGQYFPLQEMLSLKKRVDKMIYNYIDVNMPEWAREPIQSLVDKGVIQGNEKGELGLDDKDLRYLTWLYRAVN